MQVSNLCTFHGSLSMTSLPTTKVFRRKKKIVYGAESKGCLVWAVLLIVIPAQGALADDVQVGTAALKDRARKQIVVHNDFGNLLWQAAGEDPATTLPRARF